VDAGLAVITLPPQGSGHQPWQAVKRWTSSPSGNLNEQIITQRAAKLPVSKQKTNMILYDRHVGLLILRGTGVSTPARERVSESLDIRPHLTKLDMMLPVKEYHR
jgi:hypothetical protein